MLLLVNRGLGECYPNHKKHINHTNTMVEIKITLTEEQYTILATCAHKAGMTIEDFVRDVVLMETKRTLGS